MSEKLKLCPFCGGKAVIRDNNGLYVECYNCHMRTPPFMRKYENYAINMWNKRPDPWHTGTPTNEGNYRVALEYDGDVTFDTLYWSYDWSYFDEKYKILAWQKMELNKASEEKE